MKTYLVFKNVAGLCKQACVNFDRLDGFAPHRELPDELTVVYAGGQHFWCCIPFHAMVHFLDAEVGLQRVKANEAGANVCIIVVPTFKPSERAAAMSERKPDHNFPGSDEWRPGGSRGYHRTRR